MIKIVKLSDKQAEGSHREYCGRAGRGQEGILGNPFWMNNESERDKVCDKFKTWLDLQMTLEGGKVQKRITELSDIAKTKDVELACFCSPKRCHTESIKETIEQLLSN
jgi:Domain of unknown function (DUF4326)